jgi:hypothetical protein
MIGQQWCLQRNIQKAGVLLSAHYFLVVIDGQLLKTVTAQATRGSLATKQT